MLSLIASVPHSAADARVLSPTVRLPVRCVRTDNGMRVAELLLICYQIQAIRQGRASVVVSAVATQTPTMQEEEFIEIDLPKVRGITGHRTKAGGQGRMGGQSAMHLMHMKGEMPGGCSGIKEASMQRSFTFLTSVMTSVCPHIPCAAPRLEVCTGK